MKDYLEEKRAKKANTGAPTQEATQPNPTDNIVTEKPKAATTTTTDTGTEKPKTTSNVRAPKRIAPPKSLKPQQPNPTDKPKATTPDAMEEDTAVNAITDGVKKM